VGLLILKTGVIVVLSPHCISCTALVTRVRYAPIFPLLGHLSEPMQCPAAGSTTKVTPSPLKFAGHPVAKTTPGVRIRRKIGVPGAWHSQQSCPSQTTSIPTDSYRLGAWWGCKPEISNAQASSAFTRRGMSISKTVPL
jgi:hypothetical protein